MALTTLGRVIPGTRGPWAISSDWGLPNPHPMAVTDSSDNPCHVSMDHAVFPHASPTHSGKERKPRLWGRWLCLEVPAGNGFSLF